MERFLRKIEQNHIYFLKYLKKSNPVDVAEFVKSKFIEDKTDFSWWFPCARNKNMLRH